MQQTIIYLIRHSEQLKFNGEYCSKDDCQTKDEKIILSIDGEKKAQKLSKHNELKNIDAIYSSNYVRAICTAKYIAYENDIKINIDERLGERKIGDSKEAEELLKEVTKNYTVNQLINKKLKTTDGECNLEVRERMLECINEIIENNKGKNIVIVSHGAAIKFFLQNWCEYDVKTDKISLKKSFSFPQKIASPSILKLEFIGKELKKIDYCEM